MSEQQHQMEPAIVLVEMTTTQYCLLGLASCVFWAVPMVLGFYSTDPTSGWHEFYSIMLILTGICAAQLVLGLIMVGIYGNGAPVVAQMPNPKFGQPLSR